MSTISARSRADTPLTLNFSIDAALSNGTSLST